MMISNEQMLAAIRLAAIGAPTREQRTALTDAHDHAMSVCARLEWFREQLRIERRKIADLGNVIKGLREELAAKREAAPLLNFNSAIASRAVSAENAKPTDGSGVHAASGCGERRDVNANAGERRPRPEKRSPLQR